MVKKKKRSVPIKQSETPKRSFTKPAPVVGISQAITELSIDQENDEPIAPEPQAEIIVSSLGQVFKQIENSVPDQQEVKGDQKVSQSKKDDIFKGISVTNLIPPYMANRKKWSDGLCVNASGLLVVGVQERETI